MARKSAPLQQTTVARLLFSTRIDLSLVKHCPWVSGVFGPKYDIPARSLLSLPQICEFCTRLDHNPWYNSLKHWKNVEYQRTGGQIKKWCGRGSWADRIVW